MNNQDIREYAKTKGVRLWQIGQAFGCNDGNFSRKLRREFTPEEKKKVFFVIDQINSESLTTTAPITTSRDR